MPGGFHRSAARPRQRLRNAWRCGFNDPAHFSRAFKTAFGVSPRAFRLAEGRGAAAKRA
ncbi:MAG: helix-turn-helix domain-containing protein [Dokdonella sp.]